MFVQKFEYLEILQLLTAICQMNRWIQLWWPRISNNFWNLDPKYLFWVFWIEVPKREGGWSDRTTLCCDFFQRQQIFLALLWNWTQDIPGTHMPRDIGEVGEKIKTFTVSSKCCAAVAESIALKHFFDLWCSIHCCIISGREKMQSASWTIRRMTRNRMVTSL